MSALQDNPIDTEQVTTPSPAPKKSNRRRVILAGLLLLLVACSVYLWSTYLITRKPIVDALPIAEVAAKGIKPHYLFSIHGVDNPLGVAVTPDGSRVYATESMGTRMIHVFDRDGKELAKFTPPGYTPSTSTPVSIQIDPKGRILVSDSLRHKIDVYDAGGNYQSSIPSPLGDAWMPIGLRFDGNNLLVVDRGNGKQHVIEITPEGKLLLDFGRMMQGEEQGGDALYYPDTAIRDKQGRIYVSDGANLRVAVFDKDGKYLNEIPGFSLPHGMAIDQDQRLYVADAIGQQISVFDVSKDKPEPLFTFGEFGIDNGQFNYPNDIAIDGTGRLYIADRASNRIQVWAY